MHKKSSGSGVNLYIPTTQQRLTGRVSGFATWTQQNNSVALSHCTVHRQTLASSKLHETLTEAVRAAYFTETWRRNTRLIRKFCAEMDPANALHSAFDGCLEEFYSKGSLKVGIKSICFLKNTTPLSSHSDDPGSIGLRILQKHFQIKFLIPKSSSTWK